MGLRVETQIGPDPALLLSKELHAGLIEAGHVILTLSNEKAPVSEDPSHGEHMTDTTFVAHTIDAAGDDAVVVGYGAWWAVIVEERMDVHHATGQAKFLEHAVEEGAPAAFAALAVAARRGLGAV